MENRHTSPIGAWRCTAASQKTRWQVLISVLSHLHQTKNQPALAVAS